ncbi:hypothetical protein [Kitasatospora sp. MAP5-34]|uniref:hypothetical protein n=1 Tax=Kitasatospora sp. MAP5-34 TaxID=3035102 RepID=UPI0024739B23|nr:hypothetical protein [Kitasatospora sp. MAP5-34]
MGSTVSDALDGTPALCTAARGALVDRLTVTTSGARRTTTASGGGLPVGERSRCTVAGAVALLPPPIGGTARWVSTPFRATAGGTDTTPPERRTEAAGSTAGRGALAGADTRTGTGVP